METRNLLQVAGLTDTLLMSVADSDVTAPFQKSEDGRLKPEVGRQTLVKNAGKVEMVLAAMMSPGPAGANACAGWEGRSVFCHFIGFDRLCENQKGN